MPIRIEVIKGNQKSKKFWNIKTLKTLDLKGKNQGNRD